MKIVIIQGAFLPIPPILGGAVEKIWYRMGQVFVELGHEVIHISRSHPDLSSTETISGIKYLRIAGYNTPSSLLKLKWMDLLYSLRVIKKIPKDVDIIVTNTFWSPLLLRGELGKKVYVDVQRVPKGQMRFYLHVGMLRGCSPAICAGITKEIPTSSHYLVSYVPNPIPFEVKPTSIKRERTVLFVGRLHPEKGVNILIEAFSILEKKFGKVWKLVIVGPFDVKGGGGGILYYNQLLGLSKNINVEFVGPIYNEKELFDHYARASIFCYPVQEGSGDAAPVAPREAMAYGCVPVVSQLDCFNDFILHGVNGITYKQNAPDQINQLAEAISLLMKNEDLRSRLSQEAKQIAIKYSARSVAQRFIEDFKRLHLSIR